MDSYQVMITLILSYLTFKDDTNMRKITNTEKQARFRKKEALKRYAEQSYREWQIRAGMDINKNSAEVREIFEKAVDLPSGWTDEDYKSAEHRIRQILLELYDNPHQLANDVMEGRDYKNEFTSTPDPNGLMKYEKVVEEKAYNLAAHLISALKLSDCKEADQAAALMEVVRFVGRSLVSRRVVPKSDATAMCLASIGPQYERPIWFIEKMNKILGWNLNKELACVLGQSLIDFKYDQ